MRSIDDRTQLLMEPIAQGLLKSRIPARFAYTGRDGAPRVVPIWFHWNGNEIVIGTPVTAPKVKALQQNPQVAITIDEEVFPAKVLLIRGKAQLSQIEGVVPEYALAAERYLGEAQGKGWVEQARGLFPQMVRIIIRPEWVEVFDFQSRFPSAIRKAIEKAQS